MCSVCKRLSVYTVPSVVVENNNLKCSKVMISPLAYVDSSAKIGKNVTIHPFAYIDKNVEIGDDCEIMPHASLMSGTRMRGYMFLMIRRSETVVYSAMVVRFPEIVSWKIM